MTTTTKERAQVLEQLYRKGIGYQDAHALRRISMTLHRWFELEANGDVRRDDQTHGCYAFYGRGTKGPFQTVRIPDRETGAYKRLALIMEKYPALIHYVQTDCRGASLYILTVEQANDGSYPLDSIYSRGVAVY